MKKFLLVFTLLGGAVLSSFAQMSSGGSAKISIGIDGAIPNGNAATVYDAGIGVSLKYEAPIATNLYATVSAGYEAFLVKSEFKSLGLNSSYGFVPLKAGLKYYVMEDGNGFVAEGQLGASISTESGGGTAFAYAPGIGYTVNGGFEVGARYEAWSKDGTFGQFALRLAYRF
jgi:hypothetical protein